jgi:hypothetical protein
MLIQGEQARNIGRVLQLHQFKHWHFVMADLRLTKVPNKPRCSSPMFAAALFNFDLDQCR